MEKRIYHGNISVDDFANALIARFHQGNLRVRRFGGVNKSVIQIASLDRPRSGGQTALTVSLEPVEDGLMVQIGEQSWLGVAASLGTSVLATWRNPWNLLHRIDDIAQDIENLQLSDNVWEVVEETAQILGASFELSQRLRRLVCAYCNTANPIGEPHCIACGAPLGDSQPQTCSNCGFVLKKSEENCPNCGQKL